MSQENRNSLVVGGAGFIGSHLCDALLVSGNHVVCLDDLSRGRPDNLDCASSFQNFTFIRGDAADQELLNRIMKKYHVEQVYHLAANSDIQGSAGNPQIEFNRTLSTTWSVLCAMRECGVRRLFFASTSAVYGWKEEKNLKETDQMEPISYYGAAKAGSEMLISAFAHMNDIETVIFRFANIVGPRMTHGVIHDFIRRLKENPAFLFVFGNGKQSKPYIHVDDLIRAILLSISTGERVSVFNIGTETSTSVADIAGMVCEEMGLSGTEIRFGEEDGGWKGDVPRFRFDLNKIRQAGWAATMSSDEAVLRAIRENL